MVLPLKAVISNKTRKDGKSLIFYQYCFSSTHRVLLGTDIAIPRASWNGKRQCVSKSFANCDELNTELDRLRKVIETIIAQGKARGETNIGAYLKENFTPRATVVDFEKKKSNSPEEKNQATDFFTEIDRYTLSKENKVKSLGMANFRTMKDRMLAFQEYRKQKITFESMDYNFYVELIDFLTFRYKLRRKLTDEYGLKVSSIGKTIKQLRMFIKDRVRRKIIAPIDMTDFKIPDEESDAIYLSYEEIGNIYNLNLSHDPTLELYRDMFVLGCLTGLRFSDYSTLQSSDVRNGLLYKKTIKTDNWVVIPLRKEAATIFKTHFTGTAPSISNPVFNKYIKKIGALAGITQSVTFSYKKGTKVVSVTRSKCDWITSHTCRRSFCTNEYLAGTDISLIMKISGHKTHKEFFRYIRVSKEAAARKIQELWEARNNMAAFSLLKTG